MERRIYNVIVVSGSATVIPESSYAADMDALEGQTTCYMVLKIRDAIQALPEYGVFDSLRFGIAPGGKVLLEGEVLNARLKSSAEDVVGSVESVMSVVNEVRILPHSDSDSQLRRLLYINLYGHPAFERHDPHGGEYLPPDADLGADWFALSEDIVVPGGVPPAEPPGVHPIHIIVEDRRVLLVGLVDTHDEKMLATAQAESVGGTLMVKNNLLVRADLPRGSCYPS